MIKKIKIVFEHGEKYWYDSIKKPPNNMSKSQFQKVELNDEAKLIDKYNNMIYSYFLTQSDDIPYYIEEINKVDITFLNINSVEVQQSFISESLNSETLYILNLSESFITKNQEFIHGSEGTADNCIIIKEDNAVTNTNTIYCVRNQALLKQDENNYIINNLFMNECFIPILDRILILKNIKINIIMSYTRRNDKSETERKIVEKLNMQKCIKIHYDENIDVSNLNGLDDEFKKGEYVKLLILNDAYRKNYWTQREENILQNTKVDKEKKFYAIVSGNGSIQTTSASASYSDFEMILHYHPKASSEIRENTILKMIVDIKIRKFLTEKPIQVHALLDEYTKDISSDSKIRIMGSFNSINLDKPFINLKLNIMSLIYNCVKNEKNVEIHYYGKLDKSIPNNILALLLEQVGSLINIEFITICVHGDYLVSIDKKKNPELISSISRLREEKKLIFLHDISNISKINNWKYVILGYQVVKKNKNIQTSSTDYYVSKQICDEIESVDKDDVILGIEYKNYIDSLGKKGGNKMTKTFFEEIQLSLHQNGTVEMELNSIIVSLFRELNSKYSYRDVTTRIRTSISERYYGNAGFPDYMIIDRVNMMNAHIHGAIELKSVTKKINKTDKQYLGHKKSFENVIYTNGLKWIFSINGVEQEFQIGVLNKKDIDINNEEWLKLISHIKGIRFES